MRLFEHIGLETNKDAPSGTWDKKKLADKPGSVLDLLPSPRQSFL